MHDYCDFVIWREDNIVRQRIPFDFKFILESLEKIPAFVKLCILPELVGKYFTKPAKNSGDLSDSDVATTNGPTTDLEDAEDTLDDRHSVDDSQVVVVDDICSGDASLLSSHDLEVDVLGDTCVTVTAQGTSSTINVDSHMHHDHTINHDLYQANNVNNIDSNDGPWCYCKEDKPEGPMVMCDSESCLIQWFHLSCLKPANSRTVTCRQVVLSRLYISTSIFCK